MKIRSGVPENGCLTVVADGKKQKNICKTYTHPPHRRLRKSARISPSDPTLLLHATHAWLQCFSKQVPPLIQPIIERHAHSMSFMGVNRTQAENKFGAFKRYKIIERGANESAAL